MTARLALMATLAAGACGAPPGRAVIGVASPGGGEPIVAIARDEVRSWPSDGTAIRFVSDSLPEGEPVDLEVERARRLVAIRGLVGVVGHGGSRGSLAAAPVYNGARVPHIVPTGTSRLLQHAGPWTFVLAPDNATEGAFIATFALHTLDARRVTLFYATDEYGEGLRDAVRGALVERGATVLDEVPFAPESDVAVLVDASLRAGTPDVVVSAGRWRETARLARTVTARVPGIRLVAGDGAMSLPHLADSVGAAAPALYVVDFWLPDTAEAHAWAFAERYRRVTGRVPTGAQAMWHDALTLLATAVHAVGPDPDAIRRYLRELGRARPPFAGVTGPITFLPDRAPRLVMTRLEGGAPVRAAPP